MTHPHFSSFATMPTQRNRRLLLTLPACALPALTACGGGDLGYETEQALYMVGEPIPPNNPNWTGRNPQANGNATTTFSVSPALPAGLAFNTHTGAITGTPTQLKRQAAYTVTAINKWGIALAKVFITVTGRGTWVPVATVPGARYSAVIAPLPGGKVLVAGGMAGAAGTSATAIYDPVSATWSAAAPMAKARYLANGVGLRDGRVLVVGGMFDDVDVGAAELYDPVANAWTLLTAGMADDRLNSSAQLLPNGQVLVFGGLNRNFSPLDTVELYDPVTGGWTLLPTRLSTPRVAPTHALLPDGKTLLVLGGGIAELYRTDGTATNVIAFDGVGASSRAVALDDGSVLVLSSGENVARRYNPATSRWTTSSLVGDARLEPSMMLLADGRVLVTGGSDLSTAEIYNPGVNRWTAAAPMAVARRSAMAALLGDGSVLMVGGIVLASSNGPGGIVNASERYIP